VTARLIVEADGGSRGNPGPAGFGSVVKDAATGEVLAEVSESLGTTTNNVAEYSGLIAGLRAAAGLAPGADIEVRMDSKLVVEQMAGRWKIKHPGLRPLAAQAQQAARPLGRVTYTWVPRARNAHADRLANQAMDAAQGLDAGGRQRHRRRCAADAQEEGGGDGAADPGPHGAQAPPARAPDRATTVVLLRHGETPWSPERRFAGSTDLPLTADGAAQAAGVAARLAARAADRAAARSAVPGPVTAIVAAPLLRARETAAAVSAATGLPVEIAPAWAEVDFGDWEGLTLAEAAGRWPAETAAWQASTSVAPPGGESLDGAARRVRAGLDAVFAAHAGECVLVVSHVTPIKLALVRALRAPVTALRHMYLDVACLCETDWFPDGTGSVRSLNDTAHLQPREWPVPLPG
jgi:probable phosphoglycerate mutase